MSIQLKLANSTIAEWSVLLNRYEAELNSGSIHEFKLPRKFVFRMVQGDGSTAKFVAPRGAVVYFFPIIKQGTLPRKRTKRNLQDFFVNNGKVQLRCLDRRVVLTDLMRMAS